MECGAAPEKVKTTPAKISERETCIQIVLRRGEALKDVRACGATTVNYSFKMFREDMLSGGFMTSETATRSRWTMLKVDGIVTDAEDHTVLNIAMLYIKAGMTEPPSARHSTHTYSHTSEEGSE